MNPSDLLLRHIFVLVFIPILRILALQRTDSESEMQSQARSPHPGFKANGGPKHAPRTAGAGGFGA